jgi:hypothetical protein
MMAISDLVTATIGKPVARVVRAARRALERITPEDETAAPPRPARKSKGWRRHVRAAKVKGASRARPPGAPARVQRRPMPRAGSIPMTALRPTRR